jgi:hypothetical protein
MRLFRLAGTHTTASLLTTIHARHLPRSAEEGSIKKNWTGLLEKVDFPIWGFELFAVFGCNDQGDGAVEPNDANW